MSEIQQIVKQAVQPGTEDQVLALHKRIDGNVLFLVDPQCCNGGVMIRVIPAPWAQMPIGSEQTTWANVWWSSKGEWTVAVNGPIPNGSWHQELIEALRFAKNAVSSRAAPVEDAWLAFVAGLPGLDSLELSAKEVKDCETWHQLYWKSVEQELDAEFDLTTDEQYAESAGQDYY